MRRTFSLINQNCRTATRLVCEANDRGLSRLERVGLGIHLAGCRSCRRYKEQIAMLNHLVQDTGNELNGKTRLTEEARSRLRAALSE